MTVVGDLNDMQVASLRSSIEHTVAKIDATMSTFRADSEVTRFNRSHTTEPFLVSRDTLTVFQHAIEMSELTGGGVRCDG